MKAEWESSRPVLFTPGSHSQLKLQIQDQDRPNENFYVYTSFKANSCNDKTKGSKL